jgi:uncharacterized protein
MSPADVSTIWMPVSLDPGLAVTGLLVGTLVGLTGVGGSALMAPVLIFLGIRPLVVVGTDLAYSAVTKFVGGVQHMRYGTVDIPTVRRLATGSIPGALVGVAILRQMDGADVDGIITHLLGIALILVALAMVLRLLRPNLRLPHMPATMFPVSGALIGMLVGITSVGSGSLIAALLAFATPLPTRTIVGTDIAHAFLLVTAAALAHWGVGSVDVGLTLNLLVGAIPGVVLGSRMSISVPERALRSTLAVALFAIGFRML